jgi:sugar phosphate isomerase/epimerase
VEFDLNPPRPQIIKKDEMKLLKKLKDYNLGIAFHAPIFGIDISHFSDRISEASMGVISDSIKFADSLEPLYFNMHLGSSSNPHLLKYDNYKNMVYEKSIRNLKRIIKGADVRLTVENNCLNPIFKTAKEFEMLTNLGIDFCLDVGHAKVTNYNLKNDDTIAYWLNHFKDKIIATHLHDCVISDGRIIDHNHIGSGCINFDEIFEALKNTKCEYALIEENNEGSVIGDSLKFCRGKMGLD